MNMFLCSNHKMAYLQNVFFFQKIVETDFPVTFLILVSGAIRTSEKKTPLQLTRIANW